jgi:Domain of unknown function (DUF4410)
MKFIPIATAACAALALAGCAGSVSTPTVVQAMSEQQKATLHLADITSDAGKGVEMGTMDFDLINQKIKLYMQTEAPGVLVAGNPTTPIMKVHFTKFERGSAFARAMLAGLGQIRIEATVFLVDPAGKPLGQYEVSKDFSFGGIAGATTTVQDVEDGFAKSVVEIVKVKA